MPSAGDLTKVNRQDFQRFKYFALPEWFYA